jgi:hypothetical protein
MVTTPRLPLDARLRDKGRSLWPEKSAETLPPAKGGRKLVEREALGEKEVKTRLGLAVREVMGGANMGRWSAKLGALVANSIASSWCCAGRERERESE